MRVTTFLLGLVMTLIGGVSSASDLTKSTHFRTAALTAPTASPEAVQASGQLGPLRGGAMGFLPSHGAGSFGSSLVGNTDANQAKPYHPANVPLPATRTLEDHLLTGFVALMLVAYQLRRKHKFLRPHQFGI
jgi:hypothetical protein